MNTTKRTPRRTRVRSVEVSTSKINLALQKLTGKSNQSRTLMKPYAW